MLARVNISIGHGAGRIVQQVLGHHGIGPRDAIEGTVDGEYTIVHARNNLADASLDTGFVAEIGNVLARLADDDAGLLRRDYGTKGKGGSCIFLVGSGALVLAVVDMVLVDLKIMERVIVNGIIVNAGILRIVGIFVGHD